MARKRLLAPEHFKHAVLYDLETTTHLPVSRAFQGLWCQADRRGLFAWRPIDLRLEIFPYGFSVFSTVPTRCQHCVSTVMGMADMMAETLEALCTAGFIEYYEVEGRAYGRIPNFHRWQTFHVKEKPDRLTPEPLSTSQPTNSPRQHRSATPCRHPASTVSAPCQHGVSTPVTGTGTDTGTKEKIAPNVADAPSAPALVLESEPAQKGPKYPHYPMPLCRDMHALWVSRFGACDVSRFRKAFGSLFTIAEADRPADAPTNGELAAALKAYADLAPLGAAARFANVSHAAGCLAAIARTRRELADDPSMRSDAVMRIIHGRAAA